MSKKHATALASVALISLVVSPNLVANPVHAAAGQVTRTSGADRYATAAEVAKANWDDGSKDVVLVSGEGYADAVSASVLAKKLDAPILLTTSKELNGDARSALNTLKPQNIYIVGGNASISQSVRSTLRNDGYNLIELQGQNRYETNVAVAKKLVELGVSVDNVLLVGGQGFSDALSVAPVAAAKGEILLLGNNDSSAMSSVIDFVKSNNSKVTVVGTTNVISESMYDSLGATYRVDGGANRFETNINVLNQFDSDLKSDKLFVANASGNGYADALVASALAGKAEAPLVIVESYGDSTTNNAISYISRKASSTTDLNVIGGTGVVSEAIVNSINNTVTRTTTHDSDPSVQSIETVGLNQIKIHFATDIDEDSAEDLSYYRIDGAKMSKLVNGVAQDENAACASKIDDNTVLITLAHPRKQHDDVTITVKKGILSEDKDDTISEFEQSVRFSDTTEPTVKKVSVEGNSQLTVEFSEAVNMKSINEVKGKFKIDGRSLGNYSVNTEYSEIKDGVKINNSSYGPVGIWSNKVTFYLDSEIESGNHTLTISEGDDGLLCDAAGFNVEERTEDFDVDKMTSEPRIKSVKEVASGKVNITFDRPMDIQTAKDLSNYEINNHKLSGISGASIETDDDDTVIKLKHVSGAIETGSNRLYVSHRVKDAFGNKVDEDTRVSFDDVKDETKPSIDNITIVDSQTIRVRFTKDVDYRYATNVSNYKLRDNKDTDITDHIKDIWSASGESDTSDTDIYDIKLYRYDPNDINDDWRLTGSKYTLTIKNIIDTASSPNKMEDYSYTINGEDDVAPRGVGMYAKLRGTSSSDRDKVIIYFSEPMDSSTITDKDNYKFVTGEGDSKKLPSDTEISCGGDNKSAIIEFPSSYHVKTTGRTNYGSSNDVTAMSVFNVKDEEGNTLDGVAYDNGNKIDKAQSGAKIKDRTLRVYYDDDDLKADVLFDKAVEEATASDFTLGGITPSTVTPYGNKVTLIFKEGAEATSAEKARYPITYANGKANTNPTKIELVKAQGQSARLSVVSTDTVDETGAKVSRDDNGNVMSLTYDQSSVYNYEARPRTTCYDDTTADYWTAEKDSNGAKVYVTFDTLLDQSSGINTDDFDFIGNNGTTIKADSVKIAGNTVIFTFDRNNKYYQAFDGNTIDISARTNVSLRNERDANGEHAEYEPSSDDLRTRTITITGKTIVNPVGDVDLSTVTYNNPVDNLSTIVTFKLNLAAGDSASNYDVTAKGVKATLKNGVFVAMLDGKVTNLTTSDFVVTKKTTTSTGIDLSTVTYNNPIDNFSTVVTCKLNVAAGDSASNYDVIIKGVKATLKNGVFVAMLNEKVTSLTGADFIVTAKTTTDADKLDGAVLIDALGADNNGKTQFNFSGVSKVNGTDSFKYILSTTGNAVTTPQVGDDLSSWTTAIDGTTVSVANGTHIGIAEVDANGKAVKFVDKTAVVKDYVAPTAAKVTAANPADLTTLMTSKSGAIVVRVDGTDAAHTFTLALDDHSAFSDINDLASTIGTAVNGYSSALNTAANVTVVNGKITITSKSTGASSTVSVSASGTNSSDILKLTGFTGSGTGTGTVGVN